MDDEILEHSSYGQVMLDVDRCAGRLQHIRQVYFHRTDDDEPPEDLTEELELQRLAQEAGEPLDDVQPVSNEEELEDSDNESCRPESPIAEDIKNNQLQLKQKLAKLIVKLLIKKPDLHYYQGFHDVCLTYMTLLGEDEAYTKLDSLVDSHFKTFMQPTMNETQDFLALIPIIVGLHDSKLQEFLEQSEAGTIFALSWVITWFSHVIPNELDVEKIFKFLEEHDPHMVLYLSAAIVLHKRDQLLELEAEMSTVHHFLCQVPRKEKLPLDQLLDSAIKTYSKWSPEVLRQKLVSYRKAKLQLHNYNIVQTFINRFAPTMTIRAFSGRNAIIVIIVASAIALQFDRIWRS